MYGPVAPMSHSFLFMRFQEGEPVTVPQREVVDILRDHGFDAIELSEGINELPPPLGHDGNPEIGDFVSVCLSDGSVSEVAIERPSYLDQFRSLAYDLISRASLVMFSSGGDSLYACNVPRGELPDGMIEQFGDVNLSVASMAELP
jgi:hypothetical protein